MIQLYASALNRVVNCNGSYFQAIMSEVPPDAEQTDDAREGDAAHYVAMDVLRGVINDPSEYIDQKMPNGVYVTADMAEYVTQFTTDMLALEGAKLWVELPSDFDLSPETRILARPDVIAWQPATGTLTIPDFKYGYRLIEPFDNWTLVAYVMAAITSVLDGQAPDHINLMIYQPRPHHEDGKVRTLRLTYAEWWQKYAELQAAVAKLTDELHTGPHCYKCPGRANCRALRNAGYNAIDASHTVFDDRMSDAELEQERLTILRAVATLEQRGDAISELIMHRIENGAVYQNHYIDREQYGHWKFNSGVTPALIKSITAIDITKPGMLTTAQAIKKGVPESVAQAFSTRPKLAAKLVNKSANERAAKLFGKSPAKPA